MIKPLFYAAGDTPALQHACEVLSNNGFAFTVQPSGEVTHVLLPVPSFESPGILKGGASLAPILSTLPDSVTILGGNLDCPLLQGYRTIDLLKNEHYLSANALITAHCAIKLAFSRIPGVLMGLPVLVVGYGRIGKHLVKLLRGLGANITVAVRKESDQGMLESMGVTAVHPAEISENAPFDLIFNTVPHLILPQQPNRIVIDLASVKGVPGSNVLWARGLPGKDAPGLSGSLIAQTILKLIREE